MNRLKNRFGSCLWNSLQLVKFGAVIFFSTGNKSLCYFDNSQYFHYPPKSAIPFRGRQLACQVKIPPDPFRSRWSPLIERNLRGHSLLITLADPPARTLSIVANPIVQTWGETLAQGKELVFLQRSRSKTFYHEFQFDWHFVTRRNGPVRPWKSVFRVAFIGAAVAVNRKISEIVSPVGDQVSTERGPLQLGKVQSDFAGAFLGDVGTPCYKINSFKHVCT